MVVERIIYDSTPAAWQLWVLKGRYPVRPYPGPEWCIEAEDRTRRAVLLNAGRLVNVLGLEV